jgi:hypothetical protein
MREHPLGDYVEYADHAAREKVLLDALRKYEDVRDGYGNYSARALLAGQKETDMLSKEQLIDKLQQPDVFSRAFIVAMGMRSIEGNFRGGWDACIRTLKAVLERPQPEPEPQSEALDVDALWMAYRHFDERRSMFVMSLPEFRIALARAEQETRTLRKQLARIESWCEAYPLDVFTEPDWNEIKRLLGDTLLSQVSAANMRHVVEGVRKIACAQAPKEGTKL